MSNRRILAGIGLVITLAIAVFLALYQPTQAPAKHSSVVTKTAKPTCVSVDKLGSPTVSQTYQLQAENAIVVWASSKSFCNYIRVTLGHVVYSGALPVTEVDYSNQGFVLYNYVGKVTIDFWGPDTGTTGIVTNKSACDKVAELNATGFLNGHATDQITICSN